jgi:hypothetical protein
VRKKRARNTNSRNVSHATNVIHAFQIFIGQVCSRSWPDRPLLVYNPDPGYRYGSFRAGRARQDAFYHAPPSAAPMVAIHPDSTPLRLHDVSA